MLYLQSTERVNQRTHDRRWDQDLWQYQMKRCLLGLRLSSSLEHQLKEP